MTRVFRVVNESGMRQRWTFCLRVLFRSSSGLYCGAYGGREKNLNLVSVRGNPDLYFFGIVRPEVVYDEEYLAFTVGDETAHESNECRRFQPFLIKHELHVSPIGNARDHGYTVFLGRQGYDWRVSFRCISSGMGGRERDAGLVFPVDFRSFGFGPSADEGIFLLQPLGDLGLILFRGVFCRSLWRKPPSLGVYAHPLQIQSDADLLLHQGLYGPTIP